jgi:ribonucleoside-diphosphate reductase alpha chain
MISHNSIKQPQQINSALQCNACSILRSQGKEVSKSCPHAIAEYLREKHDQGNVVIKETKNKRKLDLPRLEMHKDIEIKNIIIKDNKMICPNCGEKLRMESGCISCNCGFSKCG